VSSDVGYNFSGALWGIFILILIPFAIGAFGMVLTFIFGRDGKEMSLGERQGLAFYLCLAIAIVALGWVFSPGLTSPSEKVSKEFEQREGKISKEWEQKPTGQLDKTNKAISDLENYMTWKLQPLYRERSEEYRTAYTQLNNDLKALNIPSHEEFLRTQNQHLEQAYALKRLAMLRKTLDWLDNRQRNIEEQIMELKDKAWNLKLRIDVDKVALSPEDTRAIEKLIIKAEKTISENMKPADRQDVASIEETLFKKMISPAT
jgi:hypothetical protein